MKQSNCQVKGCRNEGKYCRLHLGYTVPVVKEVAKVSDSQKEILRQYKKVRAQFLKEHPFCEAKLPTVCTKIATQIHHKKGKVGSEDYLNPDHYLATCHGCHDVIEKNPAWAKQQGFSVSRLSKKV